MKKRIYVLLAILCGALFGISTVNAEKNVYFTSQNGVELTKKEYDTIMELYGESYINNLTQQQYDFINGQMDIENREININTTTDINPFEKLPMPTRSTYVVTYEKRLAISSACNGNSCNIVLVTQWYQSPSVRSYDVFGVRYNSSVSVPGSAYTLVETNEGSSYCESYVYRYNGHGCSVKLSETASSFYITQVFAASGSGRIYGSYQHATTIVSKSTSQKYNISGAGLGGVFAFYGSAYGVYDEMPGVYIDI